MMIRTASRRRWSDAFRRSRLSSALFNVSPDFDRQVYAAVESTGLPIVVESSMFSNLYRSSALLDGFMLELDTYGFPAGLLRSGVRIVGHHPMRLLCDLLELDPPSRKLAGEGDVPSPEQLRGALGAQLQQPRELVEERARLGLGIGDRVALLLLVRRAYGEALIPTPMDADLKRALPAEADWGEAGFTQWEKEELATAGLSLAEALSWRDLGCDVRETLELREFGIEALRPWADAGVLAGQAARYIRDGRTLADVEPYLRAGVPSGWVHNFLDSGLGPEVYLQYREAGFDWQEASILSSAGLRPAQAKPWKELAINAYAVRQILMARGTLDEVRRLLAQGERTHGIEAHFRGEPR